MIKIVFIADASSIHTKKWVDYFTSKNYRTYLITFSKKNITKCENIFILGNKKPNKYGNNFYYLKYIPQIISIIKKLEPTHINAHYSYSMGLLGFIAKYFFYKKINFSVVCHGDDILNPPYPLILKYINKLILIKADKIIAVSDEIFDKIKQLINHNKISDKIFVGQYGIEMEQLELKDLIKEKEIDLFSNRNFIKDSNWNDILFAINYFKNLKTIFIMPGIEKNINKLRTKYPFIRILPKISYAENISFLKKSRFYISATKSDGTSLSLLEAMYYGAIPIISNINANRSWILDGLNGFLFKDKKELVEKINKAMLLSPSEIIEMIKINRKIIQERANYSIQMERIEKFLFSN